MSGRTENRIIRLMDGVAVVAIAAAGLLAFGVVG